MCLRKSCGYKRSRDASFRSNVWNAFYVVLRDPFVQFLHYILAIKLFYNEHNYHCTLHLVVNKKTIQKTSDKRTKYFVDLKKVYTFHESFVLSITLSLFHLLVNIA